MSFGESRVLARHMPNAKVIGCTYIPIYATPSPGSTDVIANRRPTFSSQ